VYQITEAVRTHPSIYKQAGSVHACAVFKVQDTQVDLLYFIEDVGRHNAVDAISGLMWLDRASRARFSFLYYWTLNL
jgi:FdhD protein